MQDVGVMGKRLKRFESANADVLFGIAAPEPFIIIEGLMFKGLSRVASISNIHEFDEHRPSDVVRIS
jgi:hypothetical protein